ncbi:MAG: AIR synthase family protein [Firmicutes bacterium]|jgi:hydrogenase maturation factor|nr:AIR synthase family protein [Bacillota bacterium]
MAGDRGTFRIGKLPVDMLARLVLSKKGRVRKEVVLHSSIGEDSCALDASGMLVVMSTDPITGADEEIGWLSVHISCNDLAANGAEPVGVLSTILLPEGSRGRDLERLMNGIEAAADEIGVELLGGHTEVTAAVRQVLVSTTAVGLVARERLITKAGASPGDAMIMTKAAGLEGTAILAADFADVLEPIVGKAVVEEARGFLKSISVVREGLVAAEAGATAMHDVTEGGIVGAAYEMAEAGSAGGRRLGFTIRLPEVPVRRETAAICGVAGVDPLRIVSSGAMLIATPKANALEVVDVLRTAGVEAGVIGEFTCGPRVLVAGGTEFPVGPPESDHIWAARERLLSMRGGGAGRLRDGRPLSREGVTSR